MPKTKPLMNNAGNNGINSGAPTFRLKRGVPPKAQLPNAADIVLDTAIGSKALSEK